MSDSSLRIGIIPLVSPTFDLDLAEEMRGKAWAGLETTGARIRSSEGMFLPPSEGYDNGPGTIPDCPAHLTQASIQV